MRHQNSVFHSLTKHVPWSKFEQIVEKHGADQLVRKLTTKRHFIALLYGQFSGSTSLREVVTGMASHETRLYHVGATPVKRSTMSDANSKRPWQVFSELFTQMLPQAHRVYYFRELEAAWPRFQAPKTPATNSETARRSQSGCCEKLPPHAAKVRLDWLRRSVQFPGWGDQVHPGCAKGCSFPRRIGPQWRRARRCRRPSAVD